MSAALNRGRAVLAGRQQAVQAFWAERTQQERKLLAIGGVVAGLALVYAVFFEPAWTGRIELQKSLPELRQSAAQLQALAREAGELSRQTPVQVAPMSRAGLEASLKARGLTPQSLSLTGEYARVQLTGVPFASVMLWLDGLRREGRIAVQEAKITAQTKAGLVDASLSLHQSPGAAR
ncbi:MULTISPECIES: type II secretion system protein GspM [unclassified Janthinobacterium]|uniref:type II secretion system protein GspM n=1 Tax=unclassified Janthinobacterium TaxID=2610881 RepID=UPI0008F4948A|nr:MULTISPECIES: type II secretion system protein GspM [unclassified Janthinobacterium]APA70596.1 general secretion pathway protein GspM [Janthinobacterium sp. 1_2014MBL_MicDiv]MDN2711216.1 type II secretion system protein GspM [Janthinobacterium sp. SUN118]